MVIETLNECIDKGMGLLRKTYWEVFSTGRQPTGTFINHCLLLKVYSAEESEARNKELIPAMAKAWENSLPRIEKTLKRLNLPSKGKFIFGDDISLADLKFLWLKILLTDKFFNKELVYCLLYYALLCLSFLYEPLTVR